MDSEKPAGSIAPDRADRAEDRADLLEKYRWINVDDNSWHEYIIQRWTEHLEALGFKNVDIQFTGFCSQGDGARFVGQHYTENRRWDIWSRGRYCHEQTMYCDNDQLLEFAKSLAQQIYKELEASYDYLISDEAVRDTLEANEITE
jgi:hypothetical protein